MRTANGNYIPDSEIIDAAKRQMFGLDNPGFCLNCGAEREGCEPDAQGYECYDCGKHAVAGAETILMGL